MPLSDVYTLLALQLLELCSKFMTGGTDTTSTVLPWIMANLVKHPHIQAKIFQEIGACYGQ